MSKGLQPAIGQRIRVQRRALGLTQRQLSKRANVPAARISQIELGNSQPGAAILARIEAALEAVVKEQEQ